jgi:hypothetical protein
MIMLAPMIARSLDRRRRWAAAVPGRAPGTGQGPRPPPGLGFGRAEGRRPAADPVDAAHAAWREMRADALDHGLSWEASDSPRAAARRLGDQLELDTESAKALGRIARAEELARYARTRPPTPPASLRADVKTVREAFGAAVGRGTRLRARYLPPSSIATFRSAGARAVEATGRLSVLTARLDALVDRVSTALRLPGRRNR